MKHIIRYLLFFFTLLFTSQVFGQTTIWRDIHKVKKKETIFGIAKDYGVGIQELLDANPEMKREGYELKKGEWIFVPYAKAGDKKSTIEERTTITKPSLNASRASGVIRVGVMLPLHDNDGDGKRMVEYYRGILLALNQLKSEGINADVHAWNVPIDADIRTTLMDKNASELDVIFGPLYSNQVKPLGDFCRNHAIKLVIPFSIETEEVIRNPYIFQVYQDNDRLNKKAIACFFERFQKKHHPVFIDCNDAGSQVGAFTSELRKQLELANIKYDLTNTKSSSADFAKHFDRNRPNVVVINSEKSPQLNQVFAKLNALKAANPEIVIAMFGYNDWFMYQDFNLANYFKYGVFIPSTYYYNKVSERTLQLEKKYQEVYGDVMNKTYIPRLAIVGYDQAQFFVRGLKSNGKNFKGTSSEIKYYPIQTRYNFEKLGQGGHLNTHFQLVHFKYDRTMENLVY